jgi:hypothetical protein
MEPEGALLFSQDPATVFYPVASESRPHPQLTPDNFTAGFIFTRAQRQGLSIILFPFGFPTINFIRMSRLHHARFMFSPPNVILLDLITLTLFTEGCKL